ncbi:nuclear transcription factor Y subunit gamma-like isoform X2 [Vigna unguiculata]|uniref:nuclear transcription factor Y subunit gamma-like isoform X2 n=1 Tax=Vigna unguiculata TaxID=3917 RepID=UPI001016E742|nr:nuclear transcription factor Y subunit gamma-like isoform X2 [Vigna unguiculata]
MNFTSNSASPNMLPNSVLRPSCSMSRYLQEDREVSNFNLQPLDCNNNSVPSNSMSMNPYMMSQFRQDRERSSSSNLVPSSLLTNSIQNPIYPMFEYCQQDREANNLILPLDFNNNLASSNMVSNFMSNPFHSMPQYNEEHRQGSNCNQAMDFLNNSVSSNSMLMPSCPILHYHQEKDRERRNTFPLPLDFNSNSASTNVLPNSISIPPYPMPQYYPQNIQEGKLRSFWEKQLLDIEAAEAFKSQHKLPLARIRRIMKTDADVQMVSAETPMLMSKACEIFIQELTFRAWMRAEESNKSTVQPCDVAKVIMQNNAMQFLTEIVPDNLQNFCAYGAQEERAAGNIAEGMHSSQAALPATPAFMGNPMNVMNMGRGLEAGNQLIPQPNNMIQPPFVMPSDQLPYNFHPK